MSLIPTNELTEEVEEFLEENEQQLSTRPAEVQCPGNLDAASNIIVSGIVIFVLTVGGAMMYLNRKL